MSCWVVPTVAAELWGCSVESIEAAIRDGTIPTRTDNGWTFVDMAPDSPSIHAPKSVLPPTYTAVSNEEIEALTSSPLYDEYSEYTEPEPDLALISSEHHPADPNAETTFGMPVVAPPRAEMSDDWREVRMRVAATRRAPRLAA